MKQIKGELKDEFMKSGNLLYSWAKIREDKYLIVFPKMFNRESGGVYTIISEKDFKKFTKEL